MDRFKIYTVHCMCWIHVYWKTGGMTVKGLVGNQGFAKEDTAAYWERLVQGTEDGVGKECRKMIAVLADLTIAIAHQYM